MSKRFPIPVFDHEQYKNLEWSAPVLLGGDDQARLKRAAAAGDASAFGSYPIAAAADFYERFKLRGRIRAVSAHGKMTATALSLIPVAVAILMFYTNPEYVKFFFTDDVGQIMLGSAVVLQLIGYGIMQKIVKIEV